MQETKPSRKRIGILVVAYNAVTTLAKVLRRIPKEVWDVVEEVAVFDDASKDDTFPLGLGFKATAGLEKLTVVKNPVNLGYGGNQKQGYQYFIDKGFDIVILQDVLEHLRHPEILLKDCIKVLKSNGQLLVSVPNVANITVRLSLLFGRFAYTERGILDKTHVRFFTQRTVKRLLEESGYEVQQSFMTIMPVDLALGISAHNPFMRMFTQILHVLTMTLSGLLGYQCIVVAFPKRNSVD